MPAVSAKQQRYFGYLHSKGPPYPHGLDEATIREFMHRKGHRTRRGAKRP